MIQIYSPFTWRECVLTAAVGDFGILWSHLLCDCGLTRAHLSRWKGEGASRPEVQALRVNKHFFKKNYSGLWIIQATHSTSKSVTKLTEYQKIAMTIGHVIKLVNAKYIINNILCLETRCTIRTVSEFMLIIVQTIMRCHIFNVLNCSVMDVALVSSWTPLGMALETPEIRHCSPGGPWHHRSPGALYS